MPHILLAEDDDSMSNFLTLALEKAGYQVTARPNGLEALAALDTDDHFDLLLTDIVMPGMDGIELAQQASRKRPSIKVMFITGFSAVTMGARKSEVENARILSKPFHLKDLVDQVEKLLKTP
jgi:two-component system cell cycle response regulator CpdR